MNKMSVKLIVMSILFVVFGASGISYAKNNLLDMAESLDSLDKQDFQDSINKANNCTRSRNFSCSDSELSKAAKAANSSQDKKILALARQNVVNEKTQMAEEVRLRQVEIRRREEAEERQAKREEEREAKLEAERQANLERQKRESDEEEAEARGQAFRRSLASINQIGENARQERETMVRDNVTELNRRAAAERAERARAQEEESERALQRRRDAERDRDRQAELAQAREQQRQRDADASRQHSPSYGSSSGTNSPSYAAAQPSSYGNSNTSSGETNKSRYWCPTRQAFDSVGVLTGRITKELACAQAKEEASKFVARMGSNPTYYDYKFKDISDCHMGLGGDQAVVYVNMLEPRSEPCGTSATGVSR